MRIQRHAVLIGFAALSAFCHVANAGVPSSCKDTDVTSFVYRGQASSAAPDKIYNFIKLRHELVASLEDGVKTKCLSDLYHSALQEESDYWHDRLKKSGCSSDANGEITGDCPESSEARKSVTFLSHLDDELKEDLQSQIAATESKHGGTAPVCPLKAQDQARAAHDLFCCGGPSDNGGMIRAVDRSLNYDSCIGKVRPTKAEFLSGRGITDCLGNAVGAALKVIWDSIASFLKLPGELWAARAQIAELMTQKSARQKFVAMLGEQLKHFFTDKVDAFSCYNDYEKAQYVCRMGGEVIATCAMPETMGAFLGLASKPAIEAAKLMESMLSKTAKGTKLLSGLKAVNTVAAKGLGAVGKATGKAANAADKVTGGVAGKALKAADKARRFVGRPLSAPAELAAQRLMKASSFKKTFASGFRGGNTAAVTAGAAAGPEVTTGATTAATSTTAATQGMTDASKVTSTLANAPAPLSVPRARTAPAVTADAKMPNLAKPIDPVNAPVANSESVATSSEAAKPALKPETKPEVINQPKTEKSAKNPTPAQAAPSEAARPVEFTPKVNKQEVARLRSSSSKVKIQSELTDVNRQLSEIRTSIDANPNGNARGMLELRARNLSNRKATLEAASATPLDAVRSGQVKLFQGESKVSATRPKQVEAFNRRIANRAKSGGERSVEEFVASERQRLKGLMKKYDAEEAKLSGEAPEVVRSNRRRLETNRQTTREQLSALDEAELNYKHNRWNEQESDGH